MKILVLGSIDGDVDKVNAILNSHKDVDMAVCLGDMCLASQSTPLEFFLRTKFRHQADIPIQANKDGFIFSRPTYLVYGALDDPFIPLNELGMKNLFPVWQERTTVMAYNDDYSKMEGRSIGFLSGYYNLRKFKKTNPRRQKMSRERQSMSLCKDDFLPFKQDLIEILFSYESPFGYPKLNDDGLSFGCPNITTLVEKSKVKVVFYGHHRVNNHVLDMNLNCHMIGLDGETYGLVDLYNKEITLMSMDNETLEVFKYE